MSCKKLCKLNCEVNLKILINIKMNVSHDASKYCCIETIAPRDDWLVRIGHRFINLNYLKSEDVNYNRRQMEQRFSCPGELVFSTPQDLERSLFNIIEEDPISCYNYIEQESITTQVLIPRMAFNLSPKTIDILCDRIFTKKNVDEKFVELFYQFFFVAYFKKYYSWASLHLLIKASKAYPVYFRNTLKIMLKDAHLQNNLLIDYVEYLNQTDCTNFMKLLTEIQLSPEDFTRNLPVIYLMYKKCEKNDRIFQYVLTNLEMYNIVCSYNINYGRLLLCFIQTLSGFSVRIKVLKRMTENHCTYFKTPCLAALEKFVMEIIAMQVNFQDGPRIVIPRPNESFQI